jgi:thiamine kinase-like enzyme
MADESLPHIPSLFSPFLEEEVGAKRSLKQLEIERKHIYESVKTMRERLKLLDRRIEEITKETKSNS